MDFIKLKMKNKILIMFIFGMFLLSLNFTSATQQTLGTFKQGQQVNLIQTCATCTFNNITYVILPNSTIINFNVLMTKDNTFYNYTLNSSYTNLIGRYYVDGVGDLGGVNTVWNYYFEITPSGFNISNSGIVYSVLLLVIFAMDLLFLFIIFSLSFENYRDEEGNYVGISLKKYGRVVLIGIFYGLILLTLNLMNSMANNVSGISQFSGIIGGLFLLMLNGTWVWTIGIIIWIGIMMWKDGGLINKIGNAMNDMSNKI